MYKGFVDFYVGIFISVDHTRVKLKDVDPNVLGSEYINANYIKVQFLDSPHFIETKYPWYYYFCIKKLQMQ